MVVAACGRVGFDATPLANDGATSNIDGAAADLCAAGAYELCDGFEGTTLATYWTADPNAELDTTVAHRGAHSVHMRLPATAAAVGAYATIIETKTLSPGDTTFNVRAWIKLGTLPAGTNGMEIIAAENVGSTDEDAIFLRASQLSLYEQWTDMSIGNASTPPVNEWFCVLFGVQRSTISGSLTLGGTMLNGAEMGGQPTDGTPTLQHITFGLQLSSTNEPVAQPQLDAWFDDIIVDKSTLTCAE